MGCGVGRRCGSDLVLLWLQRRSVAIAPIRPRAWEPPDAMSAALKRRKTKKTKKKPKKKGVTVKKTQRFQGIDQLAKELRLVI